jgi:probable aminopeptidase NPEPL1
MQLVIVAMLLRHAAAFRPRASVRQRLSTQLRAATTSLRFDEKQSDAATTVYVGRKDRLLELNNDALPDVWRPLVESCAPGDAGKSARTAMPKGEGLETVVAAVLPEHCSRHNSPLRPRALTSLVGGACGSKDAAVVVLLEDGSTPAAAAAAVAKAFPIYTNKKASDEDDDEDRTVSVSFEPPVADAATLEACAVAAEAVRFAQRIHDAPPNEMGPIQLVAEAEAVASRGDGISITKIVGEELREKGYGGVYGVGKGAKEPPALVVLTKTFDRQGPAAALVGKTICFDTGGLSLKISGGMVGMKADLGGGAACLAGFEAACALGGGELSALHCVLCIAENAIGNDALRCDDIIKFFGGRTCEINNTDAEGRLVLADGVAHATAPDVLPGKRVDIVVDMATLTGAQMVATGKNHAAVFSNSEDLERKAVVAGRRTGDLVHPLPFAPEFYRTEFASKVADSKNSVKDRMNAQSSCAANFIYENLWEGWDGEWLHVDLAGPATDNERGTGFGVALALGLFGVEGFK